MAYFDGNFGPAVKIWNWKQKRVWWPFLQCERSQRFLFLKKAYYGVLIIDWEYDHDMWLSAEEFMFAQLKGEFE